MGWNIPNLFLTFNASVRQSVDDRLHLIADGYPNQAKTTENTVYARDPLKPISMDLDQLKVIPMSPPINQFQVTAGQFYSRGILYTFGGTFSPLLTLPQPYEVYMYVGLKVDTLMHSVTLYHTFEYAELSEFHPDIFPLALIRIRASEKVIRSDDIYSIAPLYNFDLSHPGDRVIAEVSCLAPNQSIIFDRRPYHSGPPLYEVYTVIGENTLQQITHSYDHPECAIDLLHPGEDEEDTWEFSEKYLGVTIKPTIVRDPINIPDTGKEVFVSAKWGRDTNDGTKLSPVMSLSMAATIFNYFPEKTTIYVDVGQHFQYSTVTFDRDVEIIGHSPDNADIRLIGTNTLFHFKGNVIMKTLMFQIVGAVPGQPFIKCDGEMQLYNILFRGILDHKDHPPVLDTQWLFMSNCVCHNQNPDNPQPLWAAQPGTYLGQQNLVVLGPWSTPFQAPLNNIFDPEQDDLLFLFEDPARFNYLLREGSVCIDNGTYTVVGADVDGSAPDIGLYGGQYASMFRIWGYPPNELVVVKYSVQTMFTPVMKNIASVYYAGSLPAGTQLYGAVSFDGGNHWLMWDQYIAAWREIPLEQMHILGNTAEELCKRLAMMGDIVPKGELVLAWGLLTTDPKKTPLLQKVEVNYYTKAKSYIPYPKENLNFIINDFAVLVQNITDHRVRDLTFVFY